MSVSNQTNKTYGTGNGVTTTFSFPFKIFDTSELVVYKTNNITGVVTGPLTITTDYTATINAATEGGTLTFIVAPTSNETWFVKRIVPQTQSAVIPSEGTLPGKQIENQLDLMTMMVIQVTETVGRALTVPVTFTGSIPSLPTPQDGYAIGWDGITGLMKNYLIDSTAIATAVTAAAASATAAATSAETAASRAATATAQAAAALASAVAAAASAATFVAAQYKFVTTTRDTAAATGSLAVTGVGFKPKAILFLIAINGSIGYCWGICSGSGTGVQGNMSSDAAASADNMGIYPSTNVGILYRVSGNSNAIALTSFDNDGFTLTFTKTASPTGTAIINALCFG